ncbi:MAG TPA: diol dehydratase reactivase ATPase-like domain-containing protein [Streptosporangiaceae bacterium]
MTVIAGVDVGNATTEVVLVSGGKVLGAGRVPTRGRKGSADSLRAAAALVRRLERQAGCTVGEASIAPLRPVGTSVITIPEIASATGRLRVLAAGVPTPGGIGACVGKPWLLSAPSARDGETSVALVPDGIGYGEAAARLRAMLDSGTKVGAVLVAGDEGVLIANRLWLHDNSKKRTPHRVLDRALDRVLDRAPDEVLYRVPVIDQVDVAAAAACELLAVEVSPPGRPLRLLTDAVALGARLGVDSGEVAALCRSLADYSNAVVGLLPASEASAAAVAVPEGRRFPPWLQAGRAQRGLGAEGKGAGGGSGGLVFTPQIDADDRFVVDLSAIADAVMARRGGAGRAMLVATLSKAATARPDEALAELLGLPVRCPCTEPEASRLGALTTPGAQRDALVIDLGAGTIDLIGAGEDVVLAGAGDLLTAAVAQTLGIPRAAADWVKRGPCVRVDAGTRFEAEDGTRGFLEVSAPASAAGMLAVHGPGGLLPFDRHHGPGEWRAIRLGIKQSVLEMNIKRALRTSGDMPTQVIVVGGPAGDQELLGVLARALPPAVAIGRGNVGGMLGHRYAVAFGLTAVRR